MTFTFLRSPLGAFVRTPLGARAADAEEPPVSGGVCVEDAGPSFNANCPLTGAPPVLFAGWRRVFRTSDSRYLAEMEMVVQDPHWSDVPLTSGNLCTVLTIGVLFQTSFEDGLGGQDNLGNQSFGFSPPSAANPPHPLCVGGSLTAPSTMTQVPEDRRIPLSPGFVPVTLLTLLTSVNGKAWFSLSIPFSDDITIP